MTVRKQAVMGRSGSKPQSWMCSGDEHCALEASVLLGREGVRGRKAQPFFADLMDDRLAA